MTFYTQKINFSVNLMFSKKCPVHYSVPTAQEKWFMDYETSHDLSLAKARADYDSFSLVELFL